MDSQPGAPEAVGSGGTPVASTGVADFAEARRRQVGQLLVRVRAGDRAALNEIVDRMTPLVWNVARAQGIGPESASDVVQTTWVTLLEQLHTIRTPEALAAWLITVTRREAHRVRTAERRDHLVEPDAMTELPDPTVGADVTLADQEQYRCLAENVRKLSPRCQELLRILAFTGHTNYRTVSEILDMPKGSIGPTRCRCIEKLRKLLEADPRWSTR